VLNVKKISMIRKTLIGVVLHIKETIALKITFGGVAENKAKIQKDVKNQCIK